MEKAADDLHALTDRLLRDEALEGDALTELMPAAMADDRMGVLLEGSNGTRVRTRARVPSRDPQTS